MKRIEKIAAIIIALFILSVPLMIIHSEKEAYRKGFGAGQFDGASREREIIDRDIMNGATANRTCEEIYSNVGTYIVCKVTWEYKPSSKNITELRQWDGLIWDLRYYQRI